MSKDLGRTSSLCEKPITQHPRRLSHWLNIGQEKKIHSLIDKVYSKKNLEKAWETVRKNGGAQGADKVTIGAFKENLEANLSQIHEELRVGEYKTHPLRRVYIPKAGKKDQLRPLSIPSVRDRIVQQALTQRLTPVFERDFDNSSFGYRPGRSPHDALRKVWREINAGSVWIVDADLRDFFGSVEHEKLMQLVARWVSDGRVLRLIEQMLRTPVVERNKILPTPRGTPQGGVISPLLANILLTPFDKEMRERGYQLTRFADDWTVTCSTRLQAEEVLKVARKILKSLGVELNPEKTRIVHISIGFAFLGYVIRQGKKPLYLPVNKLSSNVRPGGLYARPSDKSLGHFKETIKALTQRKAPVSLLQLITQVNPVIRGWGMYYRRAHIRRLFNQLDRWIVRRLWSFVSKRWRNTCWKVYPERRLYEELGLVNLIAMIPSLESKRKNAHSL